MNAYLTYQKQQPINTTRIDLLLALYDGAIERLTNAVAALKVNDRARATPMIARVQLIVCELAAGVRPDINQEMGTNFLRLYEFIVHQLKTPEIANLLAAIKVLNTLREGFEHIRSEAIQLERSGQLPQVQPDLTLQVIA
jgi:flagellar biosynthetic protein FliS